MKTKRLYKYDYNTYNLFTSKPKRPILPNLLGYGLALATFVVFIVALIVVLGG
jgi:hypothetical protein